MLKIALLVTGGAVSVAVIVYALVSSLGSTVHNEVPSSTNGPLAVDSLKFLIIISRHGNRGSSFDYPADPYPMNDTRYWPYGSDGLTPRGRTEMFNLGAKVKSLYSGFIPDTYRSGDILARSTYLDRLMMSGEAFLAGLYPPRGFQVWSKGLAWQPSALYSDSPDRTPDMYINGYICLTAQNHFYETLVYINANYGTLVNNISEYVQNATGVNTTVYGTDIGFILWDKLSNEDSEGYALPEWTKVVYPDQLRPMMSDEYKLNTAGNDEVARLVVGEMYEQMLNAMIQKVNGTLTPDRKILYYSGHDTTIIAMQRVLGVPMESVIGIVRPGSALVIELHQNNETLQYYIQARYIDGTQLDTQPQVLNTTKDFSSLVNNTQKFINVNFVKDCAQGSEKNLQATPKLKSSIVRRFGDRRFGSLVL